MGGGGFGGVGKSDYICRRMSGVNPCRPGKVINRLMARFLRGIILTVVMVLAAASAIAAPGWEQVERMPGRVSEQTSQPDDVVTATSDGYLYIALRQRTEVKLFTMYRFRIVARGIYLLKVGSATRRITL